MYEAGEARDRTWFGCGYFPWGPGTAGSIAAVLIVAALAHFGLNRYALLAMVFLILLPGIWAATLTAGHVGKKDPGIVVVDEVLGQWITLLAAPVWNWKSLVAGLMLFRLFDIWKPWPVRIWKSCRKAWGLWLMIWRPADTLAYLYIGVRLNLL